MTKKKPKMTKEEQEKDATYRKNLRMRNKTYLCCKCDKKGVYTMYDMQNKIVAWFCADCLKMPRQEHQYLSKDIEGF